MPRGGKSSVDDEEQLRCAQKNQMPGRVVNPLMKNNYAVLKKSNQNRNQNRTVKLLEIIFTIF